MEAVYIIFSLVIYILLHLLVLLFLAPDHDTTGSTTMLAIH